MMSDEALRAAWFAWGAIGVAFAAFCIWLTVRIINRRERWAKRTAVVVVCLLVAYPLSMGPAIWLVSHPDWRPDWVAQNFYCTYMPVFWAGDHAGPVGKPFGWYLKLWGG